MLLSETDGEMCATFREMAVTFILLLYFTFSVTQALRQINLKVKMARSGSLLWDLGFAQIDLDLLFFFTLFSLLFFCCFLFAFCFFFF